MWPPRSIKVLNFDFTFLPHFCASVRSQHLSLQAFIESVSRALVNGLSCVSTPLDAFKLGITMFNVLKYLESMYVRQDENGVLCRSLLASNVPVSTEDCRSCADPCDLGM